MINKGELRSSLKKFTDYCDVRLIFVARPLGKVDFPNQMNHKIKRIAGLVLAPILVWGILILMLDVENVRQHGNDIDPLSNDVAGLLNRLNTWDQGELVLYNENAETERSRARSDTRDWVETHVDALRKLGANVEWNKDRKQFILVDAEDGG